MASDFRSVFESKSRMTFLRELKTIRGLLRLRCSEPYDEITEYATGGVLARYVRLTATRLRPAEMASATNSPLAKIDVVSGGKDVAERCLVTRTISWHQVDLASDHQSPATHGERTSRQSRQRNSRRPLARNPFPGECSALRRQRSGKTRALPSRHGKQHQLLAHFLLVDDMLRPFRERAGQPIRATARSHRFLEYLSAGSQCPVAF